MTIRMHIILKLQLEQGDDGLYRIVNQSEIPVAQDLISQMPILGGWYDSTIRNAVGQISMAGSAVLEWDRSCLTLDIQDFWILPRKL